MKPILRLEQVSKRFGGVVAADDVTFELMPGKVKGLIGPCLLYTSGAMACAPAASVKMTE